MRSLLEITDFTLPGPPQDGALHVAVTRYRLRSETTDNATIGDRIALLCIHGVSFHKESFLPTIEYLFELQSNKQENNFRILEAWVIDSPNHGRAGVLNAEHFLSRSNGVSAHEWARATQVLLKSGLIQGTKVVGIGHSAGSVTIALSTWGYPINELPYSSIILVEPGMLTPDVLRRLKAEGKAWEDLTRMAKARKDVWPSRAAAREWMSTRLPWKTWTPRALDLFVEHALCDLPTPTYPDRTGVTLSCTKAQESVGYNYYEDAIDAMHRLTDLCSAIPVHSIFGDRPDIISEFMKAEVVDASKGRKMATITHFADVGHLIVQEDPESLSLAIWGALHHNYWRHNLSKL